MADALRVSDASAFAAHARSSEHFRSFAQHALEYAFQGVTTIEEVLRVAGSIDDATDNFNLEEDNNDPAEIPEDPE